jgi:hypothetical protein
VAATIELVRRLALALPGVQEGVCHGTPAFYVRRKLMLRLWEDGETLVHGWKSFVKFHYPQASVCGMVERSSRNRKGKI